jgi:hypothetical protein
MNMAPNLFRQIEHVDGLLDLKGDLNSLKSCIIYAGISGGIAEIVEGMPRSLEMLKYRYQDRGLHDSDFEKVVNRFRISIFFILILNGLLENWIHRISNTSS